MEPAGIKLKLFVSHASEDKEGFVRPLASELKKRFGVWFDEYELKLGDSLRRKIERGLRECDFGVVVLSAAFFQKRWPQEELSALYALENENRKIILPVWHGLNEAQIKEFAPLLADRFAVPSDKGLDHVVEQITAAVESSERTRQVNNPDAAALALDEITARLASSELDDEVLQSEQGATLVRGSLERICELVKRRVAQANQRTNQRFSVQWLSDPLYKIDIQAPSGIVATLATQGVKKDDARFATLLLHIVVTWSPTGRQPPPFDLTWIVTCRSRTEIGYKFAPASPVLTEADVAARTVQEVCRHIKQVLDTAQAR